MPLRDVVSWTVLIMGYRNCGKYDDALIAFETMQYAGLVPNRVTMVNALAACGGSGAIEMGVWIHEFITRNGWELDVVLGTALVDMYLKCGRVQEGQQVFIAMKEKNLFTWNVLIKGLGHAKCGNEAVWWFNKMENDGFEVDGITLVNVLSACSHSGLVEVGKQIFGTLVSGKRYRFPVGIKHYACMVDILARGGCLYEALKCIEQMPFEPTKSMWGSLMNGCKERGDLELAKFIAEKLVEMEPRNGAYYVVLCNVYGEMGRWDDAARARELMRVKGLKKDSGCSSVGLEDRTEHGYGLLINGVSS
ncbi:Pentatricopeptide repeat-containing protein At2g29760, chloroplastic [Linum perenne]